MSGPEPIWTFLWPYAVIMALTAATVAFAVAYLMLKGAETASQLRAQELIKERER